MWPALLTRQPLASYCAAASDATTEGLGSGTAARNAKSATIQQTSVYAVLLLLVGVIGGRARVGSGEQGNEEVETPSRAHLLLM